MRSEIAGTLSPRPCHSGQAAFLKEIPAATKGSHGKLAHPRYAGAVTISDQVGDDAKHYREKEVALSIEAVKR